jgi:hypothetical protein
MTWPIHRVFHAALTPGGVFVMTEPRLSSNLEDNISNLFAPMAYAASTLHCMTVSLAEGGAGSGTAFGEQLARRMARGCWIYGCECP